jgi:hypothetical protein
MSAYTIVLADDSTATVDADRVDVIDGGALVFARADEPPPAGMREIFLLNARSWRWCVAEGTEVSFSNAAQPAEPKAPRVLPAVDIPDLIGKSR